MSNDSSDRNAEEVVQYWRRDEVSVADRPDRFDNENRGGSISLANRSLDEEDEMDAGEAVALAPTRRSFFHYVSCFIFLLYVLSAAAMIVILHIAAIREDIALSNVCSLLSLHPSPHCLWTCVKQNGMFVIFQIANVYLGLPAEALVLISIPMMQCIGSKYQKPNDEDTERKTIKWVIAAWIFFILGVTPDNPHINYCAAMLIVPKIWQT